jgi:hypothetical protein
MFFAAICSAGLKERKAKREKDRVGLFCFWQDETLSKLEHPTLKDDGFFVRVGSRCPILARGKIARVERSVDGSRWAI